MGLSTEITRGPHGMGEGGFNTLDCPRSGQFAIQLINAIQSGGLLGTTQKRFLSIAVRAFELTVGNLATPKI